MLGSDDIEHMMIEIACGKEPTLRTPEADAVREQLTKEMDEIKSRGGVVDVHWEIP